MRKLLAMATVLALASTVSTAQTLDWVFVNPGIEVSSVSGTHTRVTVSGTCSAGSRTPLRLSGVAEVFHGDLNGSGATEAVGPLTACSGGRFSAFLDVADNAVPFGDRLVLIVKAGHRPMDVDHPRALVVTASPGGALNGQVILFGSRVIW